MAYEIPIDSTALDALIKKLEDAGKATAHLREENNQLNASFRAGGRAPGGNRGGGGGGGGTGPSDPWRDYERARTNYPQPTFEDDRAARYHEAVTLRRLQSAEKLMSPTTPELKYAPGPHQRSFQAEQFLQNAQASGDPRKIRDAEIYADRMRKARDKADAPPKSKNDLMFEAFISSRIGPTGQLLPLISKLRAAGTTQQQLQNHFIGMGADPDMAAKIAPLAARIATSALPIALAATGVAAAVGATTYVGNKSLEISRAGSAAYWGAGGSPTTTGRGMALSSFVGKDLTSASMGLGDQLRQGSYGAGYFRSKGIADLGPYTTDKASNYVRAVDELRRIKSDREAIRVARDTGLTDELRFRDLSDTSYERLKKSMAERGSPQSRRDSAEMDAARSEFANNWDQMINKKGAPIVKLGAKALSWLNGDDDFQWGNPASEAWQKKNAPWMQGISKAVGMASGFVGNPINGFIDAASSISDSIEGLKPKSDKDRADAATSSKDRVRQLRDGTEQIGGGGRANGLPTGWSSSWKLQNTDEALKAQAMMMGAFSVG